MKIILYVILFFGCVSASYSQEEYQYSIPPVAWSEGLGNHRAVIEIGEDKEVAHLNLVWRRHDKDVSQRRFILVRVDNNQKVLNIYRQVVNNERCEIFFGPVTAGKYYFYYLPYNVDTDWGYFSNDYLSIEATPDPLWLTNNNIPNLPGSNYSEAICLEIQARTKFESFYPMEVIATEEERNTLISSTSDNYLLFPETRSFPIRMFDNIPQRWVVNPPVQKFVGTAARNEYFVFQVGCWAAKSSISNLEVTFSSLSNGGNTIPLSSLTCFNTAGIAPSGKSFIKNLNIDKGKVQALWIGVDIPKETIAGIYTGKMTIKTASSGQKDIGIEIIVLDDVIADRGDSELWRHSRLRWLNSTAGIDDNNSPGFLPIQNLSDGGLNLSGKEVSFSTAGLPSSIKVKNEEVLSNPITFSILTSAGDLIFSTPTTSLLKQASGLVSKVMEQYNSAAVLRTTSVIESDGWMKYSFEIEASQNLYITDAKLAIPYKKEASIYMMGMVPDAQLTPDKLSVRWRTSPRFDSFWLGCPTGGLHCELRGASYTGPMINWYSTPFPETWYNNNQGIIKITTNGDVRTVTASSGQRTLLAGSKITFECAFLITPVKQVDTYSQFTNRYYHNPGPPMPGSSALANGVNVVNVHHGNNENPYINYPFIATDLMKSFVDELHAKKVKTKVYYTLRMLSNHATEIWALRSLGTEVFAGGSGGGHPWLREHLVENYDVQWYQRLDTLNVCNGLLTSTADSRLYNYYVEGLKWLVDCMDIDGIYLDDVAYGRDMLKRIRKVVADKKPNFMIDLHSHRGATGAPALQYAEFFPYIDKLWFGEAFDYNKMTPENWLVESSGIPFGLMGDMLQDGGNAWRGMVYGMTSRLPWSGDPRRLWTLFDDFGIEDSRMVGYWDKKPVVTTSSKNVLATAYIKNKKILICMASWEPTTTTVTFSIDLKRAGLNADSVRVMAPAIIGLQTEKYLKLNSSITINLIGGCILIVDEDPTLILSNKTIEKQMVKVYPTLINDKFIVEGLPSASISIKNILGSVVYSKLNKDQNQEIDASSWTPGMYLIIVEKDGEREVVKVVKI